MNGNRQGNPRTTGGARLVGHGQGDGEPFSQRGQSGFSDQENCSQSSGQEASLIKSLFYYSGSSYNSMANKIYRDAAFSIMNYENELISRNL
jgi:hypothetical protein